MAEAFASFTHAADSLEESYRVLQAQVAGLRNELAITNRDLRNSLEQNQRMRTYLDRLLHSLPCGVAVVEQKGTLRAVNQAAEQLLDQMGGAAAAFAWLSSQDAAESVFELAPPPAAAIAVTRSIFDDEQVLILRDITRERLCEAERERSRRIQALAEMSALLAHEIRNPLASLELFAGLLASVTPAESETGGWVEHLQAGLRSLAATVNNVLQLYSEPAIDARPVDVERLLKETLDFLRPLARQREIKLLLAGCPHGLTLSGDPFRLQQVLLNLSLNAFRAMPSGGQLRVSASGSAAGIEIRVADSGCGIAPDHLQRIFDPGFSTASGSPGLGLAVCSKLVAQHHGSIAVTSRLGEGTTFVLQFPSIKGEA